MTKIIIFSKNFMRPCKMCGAVMKTRMILMIVILAPTAGYPTNVLMGAAVVVTLVKAATVET